MYTDTAPQADRHALSAEHAETIRATLPAVGAHITEIAQLFYRTMFSRHPELLADTFNRGNQRSGEQQKALAASVATFAAMLVDESAPSPVDLLTRIGHKHVSLGITRDQYQVVHDNLFHAIAEVLGEAVTPPVAEAWDRVYWIMADVLTGFEQGLYDSAGVDAGDVFVPARLTERRRLTGSVMRYSFAAEGFAATRPGQYTSLGVRLPDGARQLRQYSLVEWDEAGFSVAVQRDGEVSSHLQDHVREGDTIDATLPAGHLVLHQFTSPIVTVSQGIGSTPMAGMLMALIRRLDTEQGAGSRPEHPITVLHADASEDDYAFRDLAEEVTSRLHAPLVTAFRDRGERLDLGALAGAGTLPVGAQWYLCGGNAFLQDVRDQLEAHKTTLFPVEVHFELFSPNDWLLR
ncbi:hemin transporter [Citricoccus sp. SGAir0253]|uniref:globin domain-containing protein n=1 Tax=Citricoccus sp. SGAir0253 TaxID=2567881 RepID=UPI0010CCED4C|nr:globin domain-containing protein [Citricoccus sp. SGAir0253]QCU78134.1 hemin transporter [Citricoccus sp. SGAir0253]